MPETWVPPLGWEDLLEKEVTPHPGVLAWRIPWTEELRTVQSMRLQRATEQEPYGPVRLTADPWTVAQQAALSLEFSRQEYWAGLPLPSPSTCNTGVLDSVPGAGRTPAEVHGYPLQYSRLGNHISTGGTGLILWCLSSSSKLSKVLGHHGVGGVILTGTSRRNILKLNRKAASVWLSVAGSSSL